MAPKGTYGITKRCQKNHNLVIYKGDIAKSNLNSIAKEAFLNRGSSSEPNTENYLRNCFLILYQGWNHSRHIGEKLIHYKQWMP